MQVYKKDDKIIFEYPAEQYRYNPYMEEESEKRLLGTFPTFTGLIVRHRKDGNDYDEIGFAKTIDMSYKDKGDQVSDFSIMWNGDEASFREKCKELGIGIRELIT